MSTFQTSLGEVALLPTTGGTFTVYMVHRLERPSDRVEINEMGPQIQHIRLWDRKAEGGFPEVKHLKQLVRDIIDPTRDLGHVDRHIKSLPNKRTPTEINTKSLDQTASSSGKMSTARHGADVSIMMDSGRASKREASEEAKHEIRKTEHLPCEDCG